jgi:hypothetical protein
MPLVSVNGLRSGEADGSRCTQAAKPFDDSGLPQYQLSTQRMGCWPALSPFARPRCLPHRNQRNLSQGQPVSGKGQREAAVRIRCRLTAARRMA